VSGTCPESSTLNSIRPEPFGSELKAELLMAEGRPKGTVEGKWNVNPSRSMDTLKRYVLELSGVVWEKYLPAI